MQANNNRFFLQVCFAYKGDISDRIVLSFSYIEDGNSKDAWRTFYNVGLVNTNEWSHFCYDLQKRLSEGS